MGLSQSMAYATDTNKARDVATSSSDEGTTLANVQGDIEFKRVSFKSGESTMINLIERFYEPDSGQIFLDKIEIKSLKLKWLRHQMGLVSQEPILFNETLCTNIAYGKEGGASNDVIIEAAKASNAHNFIASLSQGYDTSVGERGMQLALWGQKQRIAISRAIVKVPEILLLDEARVRLDVESERVVQNLK